MTTHSTRPDTVPTDTSAAPTGVQRLTDGLLVLIVLLVGAMAGAASFTHVHDWTINNSPAGTGDWFGWANAVITELIPTAALIVIARRRRTGGPVRYPMLLLLVAIGLSLTAQLAVAEPTVFGWMVSALPALAFFALSKLVFTARPPNPVPVPTPATVAPAPSHSDTPAAATVNPATGHTTTATKRPAKKTTPRKTAAKKATPAPASPKPAPAADTTGPTTKPAAPVSGIADLLPSARLIADAHRQAHGEPITPGKLAVRMRVPTPTATHILTALDTASTNPDAGNTQSHNGTPVAVTGVTA